MSFWDFFRAKDKKKDAATDSTPGFVPMTAASDSAKTNTPLLGGHDAGHSTSTDGGASDGDGGGSGN